MNGNIDVKAIKEAIDIESIVAKYVYLKPINKYTSSGLCPFHKEKTASFIVNNKKKFFKCFGCGESGDVISFIEKINNVSFKDAISILNDGSFKQIEKKIINEPILVKDDDYKCIAPLFELTKLPIHPEHGVPDVKYEYRFPNGNIYFYTFRFNLKNGKKQVLPYSYLNKKHINNWQWKSPKNNIPLYNSHLLNKVETVLVVEGEKTCDYGNKILAETNNNNNLFVTWVGGTNAMYKSNWEILEGKNIILLPDNDIVGIKAMIEISNRITNSKSIKFIKPNDTKEKGWDIADEKDWNIVDLYRFIQENTINIPKYDEIKKEIIYG
jgi:hypothetical protein